MRNTMTRQEYREAAAFAVSELTDEQIDRSWDEIEKRRPLPYDVSWALYNYMNEWCDDHFIEDESWMDFGDTQDVFFVN